MRIPGPRTIFRTVGQLRQIRAEGGPTEVRVERVGRPRGLLFPTSEVSLAVEARSGETVRLTPELPVPWPYAWGYRLARRLGVPIVRSVEPDDVQVSLPVPAFIGRRLSSGA